VLITLDGFRLPISAIEQASITANSSLRTSRERVSVNSPCPLNLVWHNLAHSLGISANLQESAGTSKALMKMLFSEKLNDIKELKRLPKLTTRVRFPSPAPFSVRTGDIGDNLRRRVVEGLFDTRGLAAEDVEGPDPAVKRTYLGL